MIKNNKIKTTSNSNSSTSKDHDSNNDSEINDWQLKEIISSIEDDGDLYEDRVKPLAKSYNRGVLLSSSSHHPSSSSSLSNLSSNLNDEMGMPLFAHHLTR
jgi:hypothetical protein